MAQLRTENIEKCVSLLKEFFHQPQSQNKDRAILALEQLQRITAGTDESSFACPKRARIDLESGFDSGCGKYPKLSESTGGNICDGRPRAD